MNERYKQLDKQASDYYWSLDDGERTAEAYTKKFAELIVKECVSIVSKRKNQAIDDGWNVDEAMSMAEMDIEEHFGVEE